MAKDFGSYAFGRIVTDGEHYLKRPAEYAGGTVVGVFPYDQRHVSVETSPGVRFTIRVRKP